MTSKLLVYGASATTFALLAQEARSAGIEIDLAPRGMAPSDARGLREALADAGALLSCAAPSGEVQSALVDACLAEGVPYLDLSSTAAEIAPLLERDAEARRAGVMLMPGVGVLPTDCVARQVSEELPGALRLTIAFAAEGGISDSALEAAIHAARRAGFVREGGELVPCAAETERSIDLGDGRARRAVSAPWRAEVIAAFESTGVPNIETLRILPDRADRAQGAGRTLVWAEAEDALGRTAQVMLQGPAPAVLCARSAIAAARAALAGCAPAGFQTPARAFGASLVYDIEGIEVIA